MRVLILLAALIAASSQTQPPVREAPPGTTAAAPSQLALPPLSEDAQRLLDQWKQTQAGIIEQLRYLQLTYRDSGRAEDAAAIAAHVRMLQQRTPPVSGTATAELVNEGLPTRDVPVTMSSFR